MELIRIGICGSTHIAVILLGPKSVTVRKGSAYTAGALSATVLKVASADDVVPVIILPYMMPKLMALAEVRSSWVTSDSGMW